MSAPRWTSFFLVLAWLLLPCPAPADPLWQEALWLQPPGAATPFPVLLTLPAGRMPGDAAVVLLPDPRQPEALLAAEAAAVELDPLAAGAAIPGLPPAAPLDRAGQPAALRAVLRLLREETGAGLLVALGLGEAGEAALQATGT